MNNTKKAKLAFNVDPTLAERLEQDTKGMDVINWTTHISSAKGRSVTLTLRPPCPKIAVMQ